MGGSSSSEAVTGTEGIRKQEQTNIGLLTMSSESGMESSSFNMIEIATLLLLTECNTALSKYLVSIQGLLM